MPDQMYGTYMGQVRTYTTDVYTYFLALDPLL
jgi:hypothetical protein